MVHKSENYVFFHLVTEENGWLSNWYASPFRLCNVTFDNMEQFLMWSKARLFKDFEMQERILQTSDPSCIKKLGRAVRGYVDGIWAAQRESIAINGLTAKFEQNSELKNLLLQTGDCTLAECAVHDHIWGIGLSMKDPDRFDQTKWLGKNLLGNSLMVVRSILIF